MKGSWSLSLPLSLIVIIIFIKNCKKIIPRTCREEHDSHRFVAATPGAEAQRDERHKEGEQGEGCSPQQQGQRGDLPV